MGLVLQGRQVTESPVKPTLIVLRFPNLHLLIRIGQILEPMDVQALVPKTAVEGFYEDIIRWHAWPREFQHDLVRISP